MLSVHVFIGLLLLSLHAPPYSAAVDDTLAAGQVLAVGEKLVSRNGKFALGFFQPSAIAISKSSNYTNALGWYLAIWFNKIPVFTTVWVANRERPITVPRLNSTWLKMSGDGNLYILDHATNSIIWSTDHVANTTTETGMNTSATLLNSGNLVIRNPSGVVSWQSFDNPTDVVLPGAKFGWNKATGLNRLGISKKSLIDPGLGSYSVELDTTGARGLILKHRNPSMEYWSSDRALIIPVLKSLFEMDPRTRGLITPAYVDNSEEEYYIYTMSDESSSVFVSLDVNGQIKMYVWSRANQSWQSIYAQPVDPCTPSATCGPFTICNGNSTQTCDCMESFSVKSLWDWELDDRTGGCIRDTPLHCVSDKNMTSSTDMFQPIGLVTLPYDPQIMQDATSQGECAQACLSDCSCTAYSYQNSRCSVWHGKLLNVNKNDGIYINADNVLHLRLAATDFQDLSKNKRKTNVALVVGASIVSFVLALIMILLMIRGNKFKCCGAPFHDNEGRGGIIAFRYIDLAHATKNFSDKLGAGGFGSVFKGVLTDMTTIAVKKLDGARQGEKQFRAEVSSIGIIQHINLVKLIGYCCEGDKRLLVYEHMLNGSLDVHLFQSHAAVLNWITRHQIAIGVARGLSYLHESCRECIIHCDIKPENILLDISYFPKLADFGMATFVGRDFSRVLTTFRGTVGYLAPEWISGVAITPKVDVYSFGMVLFEIISGRRNSPEVHTSGNYDATYFPVRAINKLHEGDMSSLVDPRLHGDYNLDEVVRVCKVACWCIQDDEFDRPTMREVVRVLEGLQELDMPPMPRLLATLTNFSAVASM
ncbi:G-type lectin S-receptor-like serine/threonine-protein kinase At2g19130 [Oryza glaberrima]|uniref:G-type lectin S-receptor-like serine/threonine-protein kinase At2g19130 n=1 Tax=Oryza glaberrima TaxID=4538 RepID=UPI00224C2B57|nr:G-type lectin S-receptor-like serine/threonine-protein kinase At2g19130 [Oryza glaberrima]